MKNNDISKSLPIRSARKNNTDRDCQNALDYDRIEKLNQLEKEIMATKKEKYVLLTHTQKIGYTEKSGYYTYVYEPYTHKTRSIRRKNKTDLINVLYDFYQHYDNTRITFKEAYELWITEKDYGTNVANIKRLKASWRAYYENEELSQWLLYTPIRDIEPAQLREWAMKMIKKHNPNKKKYARIFTIVNQIYEYTSDYEIAITDENVWAKARKKINKKNLRQDLIPKDNTQVFTDDELCDITELILNDLEVYDKQCPTSAGLAILLILQTGIRTGELLGLKWSDISDNMLYIERQAGLNGVLDHTKSVQGNRVIPLTDYALEILDMVRDYNERHGFTKEWIFQSRSVKYEGRLGYSSIDHKLRRLCKRLDIPVRSPHKLRKTCISALLDNPNINPREVMRFAGHSDMSTTLNAYCFNRAEKNKTVSEINKTLKIGVK